MNTQTMTQQQIRYAGIKILSQHIGVVGMIRFLQQNETGDGDYTKEREQIIGDPSVTELVESIQKSGLNKKT